jgi:hypothetical protein
MTIYELKRKHEEHNRHSYFFSDETLKFFGERLSRMRVLKKTTRITDALGVEHDCIVVSSQRNKNAFGRCKPYSVYLYFDSTTFEDVTL